MEYIDVCPLNPQALSCVESHKGNTDTANHHASRWKRNAYMEIKIEEKKLKVASKLDFDNKKITCDDVLKANLIKHNYKDWNVDIIELKGNHLIGFVREIFSQNGWMGKYGIKDQIFVNFMWDCNYYYSRTNNPFHNFHHGVSVCHAANYFLLNSKKFSNLLNDDEKFGFVVAALGHDLDHRGKTNTFEITSHSKLALRYNDKSPLENHHCSILFKILAYADKNIMANVENMADLRKQMIENILSTDMAHHFSKLADFKKNMIENPNYGTDSSTFT